VIKGNYTEADQLPDRDLGKTLTPGFRNVTLETRAFGVPCIRTDLPRPRKLFIYLFIYLLINNFLFFFLNMFNNIMFKKNDICIK